MTMTTTEPKYRTITLTGRAPVRIREDQWPVIAQGDSDHYDSHIRSQSNRSTEVGLRVRQHEDGRAIVYGVYNYDTRYQGEHGLTLRAGELLDAGADIPAAIRRVGDTLIEMLDGRGTDTWVLDAVADCIADLPAEEL